MRNDFAVFILSHGRPDNVITLNTLRKANYTVKWYIVIDNEDNKADKYYKRYGDNVIMFDKLEISKKFDTADLSQERRTVVYARNACFEIAEKMGLNYFLELDDDYDNLAYRKEDKSKEILTQKPVKQADRMFNCMIDFLEQTNALTVAFGQGGDYIGGLNGDLFKSQVKRKAMNTFFCTTKRRRS